MVKLNKDDNQDDNYKDNQDDNRDINNDENNQQQFNQSEPLRKRISLKFKLNNRPQKSVQIDKDLQTISDQYKSALIANLSVKLNNMMEDILKEASSSFNSQSVKIFQEFLVKDPLRDAQSIEQEFRQEEMIKEVQLKLGSKQRPITDLSEVYDLEFDEMHYYRHIDGRVLPLKVSISQNQRWVRGFMRNQDVYEPMFKRIYNYHITYEFTKRLYSLIQDVAISSCYESPSLENCWIIRNSVFDSTVKSNHNVLNNIELVFQYLLNGAQPTGLDWEVENKKDQEFFISGTYESMNFLNTYNYGPGGYVQLKNGQKISVRIGGVTQNTQMYVDYAFNQTNIGYKLGVLTAPKEQLCTRCFWFRLRKQ